MLTTEVIQDVNEQTQTWQTNLAHAKSLQITGPEEFEIATDVAREARTRWKILDDKRKELTGPILKSKQGIDDFFKPVLKALKDIEDNLKDKIAAYTAAQTIAQVKAMNHSAAQFAAGQTPTDIIPEVQAAKGVSTKVYWTFRIVDPSLVPAHLCSPDPEKIQKEIWYADTPHTPPRPIPGIEFELASKTSVRVK